MAWTWRFEKADGTEVPPAVEPEEFTTQGDAESWVGEVWKELLEGGADQVSLFEGDTKIYGPMSLHGETAEAATEPGSGSDPEAESEPGSGSAAGQDSGAGAGAAPDADPGADRASGGGHADPGAGSAVQPAPEAAPDDL